MKSRLRQGKVERIAHANRIKTQLNRLKRHKDFTPDFAAWTSEGEPCGFLSYTHLGIEARLRYSQITDEWTATAPHFSIEISFPDQEAENIIDILNTWLLDYIYVQQPANEQAKRRQSSPAVQEFAIDNKIPLSVADEMMLERSL